MEKPLTGRMRGDGEAVELPAYERADGYQGLRRALKLSPREVQEQVRAAKLLGRGGAGFDAGEKWAHVPMGDDAPHPKYVIANADEMEPGTMKDRWLMEADPHQLLEGMIIASYAVGADAAYVFLRWAYKTAAKRLARAIAEAYEKGYLGRNILGSSYSLELYLHTSAGRYMCGEADGLLDALEGKRAVPRSKPPFATTCGLWGKPTVVNNVETLCCVPHILRGGADWFLKLSRGGKEGGTKIYGASGRVKRPGLWELPLGATVGEVFHDCAGGMRDGLAFRALLPGGASSDFITAEHFDVPMDFGSMGRAGSRLGTGTMVVLDDRTCPVGVLVSLERFFARESCGWCTPCREGLPWVRSILEAMERGDGREGDLDVLDDHGRTVKMHHTFCALAPGAMMPLRSALRYFRDDFRRHVAEKRCPWR